MWIQGILCKSSIHLTHGIFITFYYRMFVLGFCVDVDTLQTFIACFMVIWYFSRTMFECRWKGKSYGSFVTKQHSVVIEMYILQDFITLHILFFMSVLIHVCCKQDCFYKIWTLICTCNIQPIQNIRILTFVRLYQNKRGKLIKI
jgi:hypothetical protein